MVPFVLGTGTETGSKFESGIKALIFLRVMT